MAFPIGILMKVIKPIVGTVISKDPTGQDSVVAKNVRPWSIGVFAALIVVSVFTSIELSDSTLTAIGAVMVMHWGGRSYEKKAIGKAMDAIKDIQKEKDGPDG